ncbi:unnamed protein product [Ceutorhynchus assimilis]|uniref:Uncharacterized protein n=1 Tax=Ceutorhynchus assimilis TaxID=467358 RepID=A0A9N9QQ51_9CUCU|nr:unnamed protein product [Ceutorhynchus assimilis]
MYGVWFYIWPRWDELMNFKVWCDAAIQIFYSLGPGCGGILNMASYNSFTNNNKIDSILVPLCISATSITAGFVVFSVLGFMSHKTGIPVSSVASGGLGLAFVTYPEAISLLPWANFWAILFFLMLFFVGMSSAFVTIEAIITSICDEFPVLRRHKLFITFFTCCIMWACSTIFTTNSGMYWLTLLDCYSVSTSIVLISLVEVTIVGWTYGAKYFLKDIEFMIKKKVSWLWFISWKFSIPVILIAIFIMTIKTDTDITYDGKTFPKWTIDLGWDCCYVSMACIPLYMGYHLLYIEEGDFIQRIFSSFFPSKHWGPVDENTKLKWIREVKLRQVGGKFVKKRPQEILQLITTV